MDHGWDSPGFDFTFLPILGLGRGVAEATNEGFFNDTTTDAQLWTPGQRSVLAYRG